MQNRSFSSTINPISYLTANLVARPVGYNMTEGWMQGDDATNDLFRPVERFAARFNEMISGIKALGFTSIDIWCAHLHPEWSTDEHLSIARETLDRHGMTVTSYPCHWGATLEDLYSVARIMEALGTDLISGNHGMLATDRPALIKELRKLKLLLAYENHPEKDATEMLAKIGPDAEDVLGIAYDTGWAATNDFDAVEALPALLPRLFHIHAKDVKPRRTGQPTGYQLIDMGHETCALGEGVTGIETVIRNAIENGFSGPISIEHEPEDHDPAEDCRISLLRMKNWIGVD